MACVPHQRLVKLQGHTANIRNVCVLAHVDHGKTTLTDSLISSNGIISQRLAGSMRYMDSTAEEQQRQITMKSSSISLLYRTGVATQERLHQQGPDSNGKAEAEDSDGIQDYLINVIDSPGHVDFSAEVSTAVRITDGALIVVDVVEGVCIQTQGVLRQAWQEKVRPVLVLNKVDRLISELKYEADMAYAHLKKVLESVNVVIATLQVDERLSSFGDTPSGATDHAGADNDGFFSPEKGNVVFACSAGGWAFSLYDFAVMYGRKLGMNGRALQQVLWGDFYFNPRTKKVSRRPPKTSKGTTAVAPMFVELVLKQVWRVYRACQERNMDQVTRVVDSLGISVPARVLRSKDTSWLTKSVFSAWLPLANAVLRMVVLHLPSPRDAQAHRLDRLWSPPSSGGSDSGPIAREQATLLRAMHLCDTEGPMVAFVSKVFPAPDAAFTTTSSFTPATITAAESASDAAGPRFVAFARIFSGTLRVGDEVHVMGPRYDPRKPDEHHHTCTIQQLYLLMGREMEPVQAVPAGCVFGIGGLSSLVLKVATISSSRACAPFNAMPTHASPLVRVAVEPANPGDLGALTRGLDLLNRADPCVQAYVQRTGEHILVAAGEVHLDVCLRDLRRRFACVDIEVSEPLVAFRETIQEELARDVESAMVEATTPDNSVRITVSARPLPEPIVVFLEQRTKDVTEAMQHAAERGTTAGQEGAHGAGTQGVGDNGVPCVGQQLADLFAGQGRRWAAWARGILAIGPRDGGGTNVLVNAVPQAPRCAAWIPSPGTATGATSGGEPGDPDFSDASEPWSPERVARVHALLDAITSGFQLAAAAGPLCEEPMTGVAFVVHDVCFVEDGNAGADGDGNDTHDGGDGTVVPSPNTVVQSYGSLSGQMIGTMNSACREAFMRHGMRLVEPHYLCVVQADRANVGNVYTVLSRRRARILNEDVSASGNVFVTRALLPVDASFGFYEELLASTSGAASAQLVFDCWVTLDVDPFFVPTTAAELEELGDNVGSLAPNLAREMVDKVRRRKGLHVEAKLVEDGDKQRTLGRNK